MAANMAQMAPNGQPPRSLQQVVFTLLAQTAQGVVLTGTWQSTLSVPERMGKTMALISNLQLAMPGTDVGQCVKAGIDFERKTLTSCLDKASYDAAFTTRITELAKIRSANAPEIQSQMQAEAAARQAQAQMHQQQMLLNQMQARGMVGQPVQPSLQHLQHQMQASGMPGQHQQMGMANAVMMQNRQNQPPFQGQAAQQRAPASALTDINQLPPQDRMQVLNIAHKIVSEMPEEQKMPIRQMIQTKLNPQHLAEFRQQGKDPVMIWAQQQAFYKWRTLVERQQQQRAGVSNMTAAQLMQMQQMQQAQQQRQMMGGMDQQRVSTGQQNVLLDNIRNERQRALVAQQSGQMVVPVSGGPALNMTPQTLVGGMAPQSTANNQQGPGQIQRQFGIPQMEQPNAQGQQRPPGLGMPMQGQPGGLGSVPPTSQSPAMHNLNAPMRPPMALGQTNGTVMTPGGSQPGPNFDPRFNQRAAPIDPTMFNQMLQGLSNEKRAVIMGLPVERQKEVLNRFEQSKRGQMMPKQGSASLMPGQPGMTGQAQPGQINPATQSAMNGPPRNPNGAMGGNNNQQQASPQDPLIQRAHAMNNNPQARLMMDSMDVHQAIIQRFFPQEGQGLKWKTIKEKIAQGAIPQPQPQIMNFLLVAQMQQFQKLRSLSEQRRAGQPAGAQPLNGPGAPAQQPQPQQPLPPQQPPPPQQQPVQQQPQHQALPPSQQPSTQQQQQPAQPAQQIPPSKGPNYPIPEQMLHTTPKEIEQFRARFPQLSEEDLRKNLVEFKKKRLMQYMAGKRQEAQRQQQQQQQQQQNAQAAPQNVPAQAQNQARLLPNDSNVAVAVTGLNAQPANPSPGTGPKGLKRPNIDDQPDASLQTNTAGPQQTKMRRQLPTVSPVDAQQFKLIGTEVQRSIAQERSPPLSLSPAERNALGTKIHAAAKSLSRINGKSLASFFSITHDEPRLRMYLRHRFRLAMQFLDGDHMTKLKDALFMTEQEADDACRLADTICHHLTAYIRGQNVPAAQAASALQQGHPMHAGEGSPPQLAAGQPPAPLSVANLEKQTQAMKQLHSRSTSHAGHAPAAPTTSQPPIQIGSQKSPTEQPMYFNKPVVTQESLHLPPARKKAKTAAQGSSPAVPTSAGSPQVSVPSPDIKRQPVPDAKPLQSQQSQAAHRCLEQDCEMRTVGFSSDEALKAHVQEDHIRPKQEPFKFAQEALAHALGLDSQGNVKTSPKMPALSTAQQGGTTMAATLSRQGQTPNKQDLAATPMSRDLSMKRQASTAATPGKNVLIKNEHTPKLADTKIAPAQAESEPMQAPAMADDPWAGSTIDPQSLFAPMDALGGGILSDLTAYRSLTPNDTPESSTSKDSGASEPNSDISEGANIEIDLSWQPTLDADLLFDMNKVSMEGFDNDMTGGLDPNFQVHWDDVPDRTNDFSKPYQFDTSMFSLDPS